MKLPFTIAWRFLTSSKMQTLLIALGIAVGVSVQVFIGTLITSLQTSLLDTTIGRSSQITVTSNETNGTIANYEEVLSKIEKSDSSIQNINPAADGAGFIKVGEDTYPIFLRGFNLPAAEGIYQLSGSLVKGEMPTEEQVIVGTNLAEKADIAVGDSIEIATPLGETTTVEIAGIYDLGVANLNESWVIGEIPLAQNLFGYGAEITSIEMQVSDVFKADTIAASLQEIVPSDLSVSNWKDQNAALLGGLSGQSTSSIMIQVFVMISVVLGISSVLAISVLQKSKQLGILKAMGIKNSSASLIFLFQGLMLGVFGALLGTALGLGLTTAFTTFALNPDGTPIIELYLEPSFIVLSAGIAIAAATFASLIPARRSSKLDPMEVIKNG